MTPLGLGSSYGLGAKDVERAFERGINYFYWGTRRSPSFGQGLRRIAARSRERMVLVVQSYARFGMILERSVEHALKKLGTDHADLVLLGWWDSPPPPRIVGRARALGEKGRARHLMVSCHRRATFQRYIEDPTWAAIMVRYNAAHPGAELDVFPHLSVRRPGVVSYTATRWGALLDEKLMPEGEKRPRAADCYRFVLSNPNVDVALCGPKNGAELDEAMAALDLGPMNADELAWMKRVGAHVKANAPLIPRGPVKALRNWLPGAEHARVGEMRPPP